MKHHQSRVKHFTSRTGRVLPLHSESDGSAELAADPHSKARRAAAMISISAMKRGVRFLSEESGTMTQPTPFTTAPRFDGETIDIERDDDRLRCQLRAVQTLMADGCWRTLLDIAGQCGYPESSTPGISARLRDLRKSKFGSHTVERRYLHGGLWQYRVNSHGA